MSLSRWIVKSVVFLLIFFGVICPAIAGKKPVVFVSILPQKYFIEQLAGESVEVEVMVPPGASPATYEPRPSQMKKLAVAKIYCSIGVPFESSWLSRLRSVAPDVVLVKTDATIKKRPISTRHHNSNVMQATFHRAIADPHIWLSPPLVKQQVEKIAAALISLLPNQTKKIKQRLVIFSTQIDELNSELHTLFQSKRELCFMVFHPSWGYFADEYGIRQEAVEISGKKPKPMQLAKLIKKAKAEKIHTILVQPQFSRKSAALIAKEIGGKVVTADPLALNWSENIRKIAYIISGASE